MSANQVIVHRHFSNEISKKSYHDLSLDLSNDQEQKNIWEYVLSGIIGFFQLFYL